MKKFYKLVSHKKQDGVYLIELDGRPVKTPSGQFLHTPAEALAIEIAAEWAAQDDDILPDTMPLTQILTTAIDRVRTCRADITRQARGYIDTDLICYRADPAQEIADIQATCWDQWTSWFEKTYGVKLETTEGIAALKQPRQAHDHIAGEVDAMDEAAFTAFQLATMLTGSAVLGLAFAKGDASPEQIYEAANIEENYKAKIYNEDEHGAAPGQENKQQAMKRDLEAARKFLDLCKI